MITVRDLHHVENDVVEAWADHLSTNLRKSDLDEVEAMAGTTPERALRDSLALSSHAFAVTDRQGDPIAMFGAAPHPLDGIGVVWMLGTDGIVREGHSIARRTRRYFNELTDAYPLGLWNYVDARNAVSMRWLRWGGFKRLGKAEFGGHPFHIYARTSAHV